MQLREFVTGVKEERDALLASYAGADAPTNVAEQLRAAKLTDEQRCYVLAALDAALTDAFYTLLLGLDGAASLNGSQQSYRIIDERGNVVSPGDGSLEALAFDVFQTAG